MQRSECPALGDMRKDRQYLCNNTRINMYFESCWSKPKSECLQFYDRFRFQTDVRLDPNRSENGKYNLISVWINKIPKSFLCVEIPYGGQHWQECARQGHWAHVHCLSIPNHAGNILNISATVLYHLTVFLATVLCYLTFYGYSSVLFDFLWLQFCILNVHYLFILNIVNHERSYSSKEREKKYSMSYRSRKSSKLLKISNGI